MSLFLIGKKCILDVANDNIISKRTVLRVLASIYDPLGILSPAVVILKLLFQEICALKLDWDVPLVDNFVLKWRKTIAALISIDAMSIPLLLEHVMLSRLDYMDLFNMGLRRFKVFYPN